MKIRSFVPYRSNNACTGIIDTGGCIVDCQFNKVEGSTFCERHLKYGSFDNIHGMRLINRSSGGQCKTMEACLL